MKIDIKPLDKQLAKTPPKETPVFGKMFTNRMFSQLFNNDKGWYNPQIGSYKNITLSPSAQVFHYGQEIFEGLKAYKTEDGRVLIFRPQDNIKRFNLSAVRMQMPEVDEDLHLEAMKQLVSLEKEWIPNEVGASLYLRPVMIATEATLWMPSSEYLHYIIACPTGPYIVNNDSPTISVIVEEEYKRAVRGGSGEAKTGGNYAAGLKAHKQATEKGYNQVLWLDALEGSNIEEAGTMNVFFVYKDGSIATPKLNGSILNGVTRKSTLTLAKDVGYKVIEKTLPVSEVVKEIENGKITEAFGTGTAASILPIGKLGYQNKDYIISKQKMGQVTSKLRDLLSNIQYGISEDPYGWTVEVN